VLPSLTFTVPLVLLILPVVLGWTAWLWLQDQGNLSRVRHRVALALRLLILTALALVLAGATYQQPETRQATVFVADLSASTAGVQDREAAFIDRALKARGRDDVAAVVAVGGDAQVEQGIARPSGFTAFASLVDRSATDLEAGLNLAGALFPSGYRKRVVLLTDGQQNVGDTLAATRLLHDEGVRLDVVPLAPAGGPEVLVSNVDVPSTLHKGDRVPLTVFLNSTVAQTGTLDVYDDARHVARVPVTLDVGDTRVPVTLPPLGPGFHRLRVVLNAPLDTVAGNDEGEAVTHVRGAPAILVAEGLPGEGDIVAASLRARGMTVVQESAAQVQASAQYLGRFDGVALVDAPALELDPALLDPTASPLRAYVDGGGGLVVIGGPNSYGVGGYTDTALDDLLPVSMRLPQRKDTPAVAVALIIENLETDSNVNISKAAGEGVVRLLTPADRVEVNDANGTDAPGNGWAVPLQYVANKTSIDHAIDAMQPVDPMSYVPSLNAAYNSLSHTNARIKHIILLGDGDATDDYYATIHKIAKAGITISTVATGAGGFGPSNYGVMQDIARWGHGHYYQSDNVANIPQIFLKETKQIARTGLVEAHFTPEYISASPIIAGLPGAPLDGYVATTPKPQGNQVLVHVTKHGLDPILSQWQYGLGRVVAWTSDARGQWTSNIVGSARGNALWANMVSWVLPPDSSPNLSFSASLSGGQAHLTVTTTGLPLDAQVTARIDGPAGPARSSSLALQPTAPGQYEADVPASATGAYLVGIRARGTGGAAPSLRTSFVVPYAPEYRATGLNSHLVSDAAAAGDGVLMRESAAGQSFADNLAPVYAPLPLTTWLLLLALLLLPFDVAVRRLLVGPAEVREALAALRARRARRLQPAGAGAPMIPMGTAAAPLTTLRARRSTRQDRVATQAASGQQPPASTTRPSRTPTMSPPTPRSAERRRPGEAVAAPTPISSTPAPASMPDATTRQGGQGAPGTAGAQDDTMSRLLEAKRRRRR